MLSSSRRISLLLLNRNLTTSLLKNNTALIIRPSSVAVRTLAVGSTTSCKLVEGRSTTHHLPSIFVTTTIPSTTVRCFSSDDNSTSTNKNDDDKDNISATGAAGNESTISTNNNSKATSVEATTKEEEIMIGGEKMEFQAETRQLLDIVTHSLYTDKEVFLRELISNASDSLEKLRHVQQVSAAASNNVEDSSTSQQDLEIRINLDEVTSSITITDTGIGMTKDELITNLGTIAKSGSKDFIQKLKDAESGASLADPIRGIIGKFGVGFYSAFMVAKKVEVRTKSATSDETPKVWSSDGTGSYIISELPNNIRQERGSSVIIYLKDEYWGEYINENNIEKILKRYSNFVNFPIYLNGKRINTLRAIWSLDKKEVSNDEYNEFYKYIANAIDEPLDIYHFRADAPIDIKVLFYIPSFHSEKYGMSRMEPGVSVYSRKVLIEANSPDIVPDWMRFIKGVVDSEDLPLAISREKTQDTALITKLRRLLTRKFIDHLMKMAKKDNDKYLNEFYKEYSFFIKEGICQDYDFQSQLSKLLRYETSKNNAASENTDDMISLDEYIARMRPEQKDIYYLVAPSRDAALHSPYLEAFESADVEVLLMYSAIDDFVMANVEKYEGRKLICAEKGDIDLSELTKKKKDKKKDNDEDSSDSDSSDSDSDSDEDEDIYKSKRTLTKGECVEFCTWYKNVLGTDKVGTCTITNRLSTSPAIITDNESGAMRRMMRLVDASGNEGSSDIPLPKQNVEINPKHPIIVGIYDIHKTEPTLAKVLAEQIYDNCLIAAGLLDDSRSILPRLNDILICVVQDATEKHAKKDNDNNKKVEETVADASTAIESSDGTSTEDESTSTTTKEASENASKTEK